MEIAKFSATIDLWINELSRFDIHHLLIKPDDNSWSLGQVYEHIIEETTWYMGQAEVALADTTNAHKPISQQAKVLFERGTFEDKRIQGDPLISENVNQPTSLMQLKIDLVTLRQKSRIGHLLKPTGKSTMKKVGR